MNKSPEPTTLLTVSGPEDLGEFLRKELEGSPKGTQAEMADACGVTEATVSRWVNGKVAPHSSQWTKIEAFLDVPAGTVREIVKDTSRQTLEDRIDELTELTRNLADEIKRLREQ